VSSVPWQLVRLKHNIGLPAARNLGIRLARGEFIFMLDADNHLLPQCIESHLREAEASKADATYGMIRTFGSVSTLLSDGQFSAERLAEGPYIDAMAMFRRSVLLDLGLYATDSALYGWEDYELWVRLAARERRVAFIPAVLSHYRFHQQNMISIASLDTRAAWTYLFASYPEIFGKMSADEKDREVERRAWWIAESGKATLRPEGPEVGCGCGDPGSS
jgi:glycosyltransferase involved in cell wall biosynthesis